jgi:hypothetical protein
MKGAEGDGSGRKWRCVRYVSISWNTRPRLRRAPVYDAD